VKPRSTHRTAYHRGFMRLARILWWPATLLARWDMSPVMPAPAPVIVAANHRSMLDVVVGLHLFRHVGASLRIMIAERYFNVPIVGRLLRSAGAIPLGAGKSAFSGLKTALAALEAGESVVILPEGRLMHPEERAAGVGPAAAGIGVLTSRSNAVLVLGVIRGSEAVWPSNKRLPRLRWRRPLVRISLETLASPAPEVRSDRSRVTEYVMLGLSERLSEPAE